MKTAIYVKDTLGKGMRLESKVECDSSNSISETALKCLAILSEMDRMRRSRASREAWAHRKQRLEGC